MASKCVHKGCGKEFTDPNEECVYHPGPPVFHEGQKGWKCCKPRVLTFEEFLSIPPCTTGTHSTVDDTPVEKPQQSKNNMTTSASSTSSTSTAGAMMAERPAPQPVTGNVPRPLGMSALAPALNTAAAAAASSEESESDDPSLDIPPNATCRRRGCNATYDPSKARDEEVCLHHPGQPVFHEGSKGWSCCKRKVLEFEEFLKIQGCKEKKRHLFVGKAEPAGEVKVDSVRNDFYQTATSVNVSLYLKKIDKEKAKVDFSESAVSFDLPTTDNKRFQDTYSLFAPIDPAKSQFRVLGTKLEMTLVKADASTAWPVLRSDDKWTGERIQIGNAGRA